MKAMRKKQRVRQKTNASAEGKIVVKAGNNSLELF